MNFFSSIFHVLKIFPKKYLHYEVNLSLSLRVSANISIQSFQNEKLFIVLWAMVWDVVVDVDLLRSP